MPVHRPPAAARGIRPLVAAALSAAVLAVPLAGVVASGALARRLLTSGEATTEPAAALLTLAATALAAVLAWATAAAAAGVRQGWQHTRAFRQDCPPGARRSATAPVTRLTGHRSDLVAAAVAGLVVAALTAPPASAGVTGAPSAAQHATAAAPEQADPQTCEQVSGPSTPGTQEPADPPATALPGSWSGLAGDGFRAPSSDSSGTAPLVTGQATRRVGTPAEVVVTAGDSLWSIAARHLGPDADDVEVAAAWPAWWRANRSAIGEDPDLLLPGQRLQVPDG